MLICQSQILSRGWVKAKNWAWWEWDHESHSLLHFPRLIILSDHFCSRFLILQQYRRFQLKFSEESSAQSFVALIQVKSKGCDPLPSIYFTRISSHVLILLHNVCPVIVKAAAPSPKKENAKIVNPKTHTFTKSDDESFIGSSSPLENLATSPTLKERSSSSLNNSKSHRYSPPASPLHSIGQKVHSEIPSISSSYPMTNFSNGSGASKSILPSSLESIAGGTNQTSFNASRSETLPISQFSSASQRNLQSASVHSLKSSAPTYSKTPFPWKDTQQSQSLQEDAYSQSSASQPSPHHQKCSVDDFSSDVVDEETFGDTSFIEASTIQVVKPKAKSGFQSPLKKKPRLDTVEEIVAASNHSHTQEQVQVQERGSSPLPLDVGMKLSSSRSISLSPSSPVHRSSSPALQVELNSSISPSSQTSRPRPPLFIPSNSQSQTSLSVDKGSLKSQTQNPFFLVEGEGARGSQSSEREIRKMPERFLSSQQQRQQSAVFRSASPIPTPKEVQSEVPREDSRNVLTSGIDSLDQLASIPTTIPQLDTSNMDFTDFQSQVPQKQVFIPSLKTGIEAALSLDDKQMDEAVSEILDSSDFVSLVSKKHSLSRLISVLKDSSFLCWRLYWIDSLSFVFFQFSQCKRVEASVARQMKETWEREIQSWWIESLVFFVSTWGSLRSKSLLSSSLQRAWRVMSESKPRSDSRLPGSSGSHWLRCVEGKEQDAKRHYVWEIVEKKSVILLSWKWYKRWLTRSVWVELMGKESCKTNFDLFKGSYSGFHSKEDI